MTDSFEKFSLAISELYYYLHKITREEMEKYGLSGPHAIYFFILADKKDGLTCAELSEASFKNKADVSRAVALFEKKGLVRKIEKTNNSYRAKIVLTDDGMAAAKMLQERSLIVSDMVSDGLTEEKRNALYEAMALIASNMKEICREKTS